MPDKRQCLYCGHPFPEAYGESHIFNGATAVPWLHFNTTPAVARCPRCFRWNIVDEMAIAGMAPVAPPDPLHPLAVNRVPAALSMLISGRTLFERITRRAWQWLTTP